MAGRFFFTAMLTLAEPFATTGVLDAFRSDRVRDSGARLRTELAVMLCAVTTTAERAVERARASRAAGEHAVRRERERLSAIEVRLHSPMP